MTAANTNALNLLGKEVSFDWNCEVHLTDHSSINFHEKVSGTVTNIVLGINSEPEISVNDGDFYVLSELQNFEIAP